MRDLRKDECELHSDRADRNADVRKRDQDADKLQGEHASTGTWGLNAFRNTMTGIPGHCCFSFGLLFLGSPYGDEAGRPSRTMILVMTLLEREVSAITMFRYRQS